VQELVAVNKDPVALHRDEYFDAVLLHGGIEMIGSRKMRT
jgi:hypothetical protein